LSSRRAGDDQARQDRCGHSRCARCKDLADHLQSSHFADLPHDRGRQRQHRPFGCVQQSRPARGMSVSASSPLTGCTDSSGAIVPTNGTHWVQLAAFLRWAAGVPQTADPLRVAAATAVTGQKLPPALQTKKDPPVDRKRLSFSLRLHSVAEQQVAHNFRATRAWDRWQSSARSEASHLGGGFALAVRTASTIRSGVSCHLRTQATHPLHQPHCFSRLSLRRCLSVGVMQINEAVGSARPE
jgi:hypothetical protein